MPAHLRFLLGDLLHVVEEFKKHNPGEHRQTVEIAVEPFVLAHDVAAGLNDGRKPLGGGERLAVILFIRAMVLLENTFPILVYPRDRAFDGGFGNIRPASPLL